tara:strand:- start:5269 stop:7182 length:1914 start_codon:yes stop_codon:yes gene_type:complete
MATNKHIIQIQTKGAEKSKRDLKGINSSLVSMGAKVAAAGAAFYAVKGVINAVSDLAKQASKVKQLERGFDNLGKKIGFNSSSFDKLDKAVNGTMNQVDLMTKANNAMMLGVVKSDEEMAQLFDTAQRLGQALGVDTVQSIDSIVTGMGRQSKLMLDNLGIMIDTQKAYEDYAAVLKKSTDQLTESERKTAFNNAVLEESSRLVDKLGEEVVDSAMAFSQMDTAINNASIAIGDLFTPIVTLGAKAISFFAQGIADSITHLDDLKEAYGTEFVGVVSKAEQANRKLMEAVQGLTKAEIVKKINNLTPAFKELSHQQVEAKIASGELFVTLRKTLDTSMQIVTNSSIDENEQSLFNQKYIAALIKAYGGALNGMTDLEMNYSTFAATISTKLALQKQEQEFMDRFIKSQHELGLMLDVKTSQQLEANTTQEEFLEQQQKANELQEHQVMLNDTFIQQNPKLAKSLGLISSSQQTMRSGMKGMVSDLQVVASEFKSFEKIAKATAIAQTIFDTYESAQQAFTNFQEAPQAKVAPSLYFGLGVAAATTATIAGLARVQSIKKAQYGANFVTDGPQMMMVGEGSGPEKVQVTPLDDPNIDGPQGQGITLNISGNVLHESFVEDNIIPQIREGLRLGENMGI